MSVQLMIVLSPFGGSSLRIEGDQLELEDRNGTARLAIDSGRARRIAEALVRWAREEEKRESVGGAQ